MIRSVIRIPAPAGSNLTTAGWGPKNYPAAFANPASKGTPASVADGSAIAHLTRSIRVQATKELATAGSRE